MSLINKMLQDLDARGTPKDGALPGQVKPVARPASAPRRGMVAAAVLGALAVLVVGGIGWKMLGQRAQSIPAVATAAAPAARGAQVPAGVPAVAVPAEAASVAATPVRAAASMPAPHDDPMAPPAAAAGGQGAGRDDAQSPVARTGRERPPGARKEEDAATAAARTRDVAPMEPDSGEARAARQAMAQILAGRSPTAKKRSATVPAATRTDAHDEPAAQAGHAAQGRQESAGQRAEGEYRRALASLQEGRTTDTIAALERALKIDPTHEAARQTLVGVLVEANRTDEAMRQLQLGLTLDARQPALAMLLARLQIERGGSGIETLTRTLPYAGGDPDYRAFLAAALARQQRHREAAEQYVQAVRAAPGNGVWWMGLGLSLQADRRNAEALEAFQKARATGALAPDLQAFVERRIQLLGH